MKKNLVLGIVSIGVILFLFVAFIVFKSFRKEEVSSEFPPLNSEETNEGTYLCLKRLSYVTNVQEIRIEHTIIDDENANEFIVEQYTAYTLEEENRLQDIQNELLAQDYNCATHDKNPKLICSKNENLNVGPGYIQKLKEAGYTCQKK